MLNDYCREIEARLPSEAVGVGREHSNFSARPNVPFGTGGQKNMRGFQKVVPSRKFCNSECQ
jgi:hypothetical protein